MEVDLRLPHSDELLALELMRNLGIACEQCRWCGFHCGRCASIVEVLILDNDRCPNQILGAVGLMREGKL